MTSFNMTQAALSEIRTALPETIHVSCVPLTPPDTNQYAVESAAMERAVPKRQAEFASGRRAARQALAQLGHPACPIPMADDRAPVWPNGVVGSVAHSNFAAVAVVAASDRIAAIGIDLEPDMPVDAALVPEICSTSETQRFETDPGITARRVFSAKEAAYKAQYPSSKTVFGFDGFSLTPSDHGHLIARFTRDIAPFTQNHELVVHQWQNHGVVLSMCWWEKEKSP